MLGNLEMRKGKFTDSGRATAPVFSLLVCIFALSTLLGLPRFTRQIPGPDELAREFAPVDLARKLYAVPDDDRYILRPVFHEEVLGGIRVNPKYSYQETHPEWKEPDERPTMSLENYKKVLARIEKVRPLGQLRTEAAPNDGYMSNSTDFFWDEYENAVIERGMYRRKIEEPYGVFWFRVAYFRQVLGHVENKLAYSSGGGRTPGPLDKIVIDGKRYWVTREIFEKVKIGERVTVPAAGPDTD
jgi:hypothetical protein